MYNFFQDKCPSWRGGLFILTATATIIDGAVMVANAITESSVENGKIEMYCGVAGLILSLATGYVWANEPIGTNENRTQLNLQEDKELTANKRQEKKPLLERRMTF